VITFWYSTAIDNVDNPSCSSCNNCGVIFTVNISDALGATVNDNVPLLPALERLDKVMLEFVVMVTLYEASGDELDTLISRPVGYLLLPRW
jgi:hypothetical protein